MHFLEIVTQQTQNTCITFIQRRLTVVEPILYKCYTIVWCLSHLAGLGNEQQTRGIGPMLGQYWTSINPTFGQQILFSGITVLRKCGRKNENVEDII